LGSRILAGIELSKGANVCRPYYSHSPMNQRICTTELAKAERMRVLRSQAVSVDTPNQRISEGSDSEQPVATPTAPDIKTEPEGDQPKNVNPLPLLCPVAPAAISTAGMGIENFTPPNRFSSVTACPVSDTLQPFNWSIAATDPWSNFILVHLCHLCGIFLSVQLFVPGSRVYELYADCWRSIFSSILPATDLFFGFATLRPDVPGRSCGGAPERTEPI
jgi:hypothetical protein